MLGKDYPDQDCTLARALEVIGERWTLLIVRDAFYGVRRFSDFADHLDIPRAVLADRLRGLVEAGVLERRRDPDHAGRDLYELTADGRALWPALHGLVRWGERFDRGRAPSRTFVHSPCDTRLDERGVCPVCDVVPAPGDVSAVAGRRRRRTDRVSVALRPRRRLLEPVDAA